MADGGTFSTANCIACGLPADAAHLLATAMRRLDEARALADDTAGRGYAADPALVAQQISETIRAAQILVSRAHG